MVFVWMQGEADAKYKVSGEEYGKSLAGLKQRLEQDSKTDAIPMVAGAVLPRKNSPAKYIKREAVKEGDF